MGFWGAFASGAGTAAGSNIVDLLTAGAANRNQNALNRNLQRQAMAIQENQFAASLQHDADMADMNAQLQAWLMREQDALNSPERMVKRLLKAGISPSVLFGNGGNPLGNASSAPSVHGSSVPSSVSMPSGSSAAVGWPSQFGDTIAKMLSSIGGYRLNSQEADKIKELLPMMVDKGILDVQQMQEQVFSQQLENYVKNEVKDVRIKQYTQDWLNSLQDYYLKLVTEDKFNAEVEFQRLLNKGQLISNETNDFQLKYMLRQQLINLRTQNKVLLSEIGVNQSETRRNDSVANYNNALARTENDMREWRVMSERYGAYLNKNQFTVLDGTTQQRMNRIVNETLASELLPEQVRVDLEKARKANDWYEVNQILGIVDTGVSAYSAYKGAQNQGFYAQEMQVRNEINSRYNEYLQNNDVNETRTYQLDGKGHVKSSTTTYSRRRPRR